MFFQKRTPIDQHRRHLMDMIPEDARCVEVGVWKGDFSAQILSLAAPRELHLVDPWLFQPAFPGRWYGGAKAAGQYDMDRIYRGVVQRFAARPEVIIHRLPSVAAAAELADGSFDWAYIDGDHSYEAVKADLAAWYPKIKLGGALAGDDYDWRDEAGRLSVKQAVDEFLRERQLESASMSDGQFIIYRLR